MRRTFTYNGKRYSVSRKTKKELDLAVAEKRLQLSTDYIKESNITFSEYAQRWLNIHKEPYIGKSSVSMYRANIKTIEKSLGGKRLKDVTPTDVQGVITDNLRYSKSKIDKIVSTLRQIFRQAVADNLIARDPTITIKRPQRTATSRRALCKCEYYYLTEFCKTHIYGNWVLAILYLGLRPMEASYIQRKDIANGYVHIKGTKTDRADRYIPIPEALIFDLQGLKPDDYVFTSQAGNRLTETNVRRRWKRIKRDLNISLGAKMYRNEVLENFVEFTLYNLRHTFGTRAQMSGVPIDVLADLMGHSKIDTTRRYYISDNLESKEAQRNNLNRMWDVQVDVQVQPQTLAPQGFEGAQILTGSHEVRGSNPLCSTMRTLEFQ